jgi:two-component system chemotaxis response regulator CheB
MEIARGMRADLPAALFVVSHTSPTAPRLLPEILESVGPLPAVYAEDGEPVRARRIVVARPDFHLLLERGRVRVTRGPKENRFRPAVDPLFRSAALAYGPRVVGVILSGGLDDGAAGLWAVKTRGGIAVVQDPQEAAAPSMPRSALRQTQVDYCLRMAEMPSTLARLATESSAQAEAFSASEGLEIETRIALQENPLEAGLGGLGRLSPFTCPECHGILLRLEAGGLRFRCHTGHAYTAAALFAELTETVEAALWNAVRSVQETSILMEHLAAHAGSAGDAPFAAVLQHKATEARLRAEAVRRAAMEHEAVSGDSLVGAAGPGS